MLRALKVGHILGIDINVHPTFGLVVLWAIWQWGIGPARAPLAFLLGIVLVALLFASVLLHEMGHSVMAAACGNRVLDITLWPFGGVARIEQAPMNARNDILIAVAGPLTNLAVAVSLLPVILFISVVAGIDAVFPSQNLLAHLGIASLLGYLMLANVLIMALNLIPAFPFDGGRLLRAILDARVGRESATRMVVMLGVLVAIVIAVVGLWTQSPAVIVLGIVVALADWGEARAERVLVAMQRLTVGQYALWDMGGISPNEPLTYALRGGPRDIAVTEDGRVVGMLWRTRLLESIANGMGSHAVGDVMDRDFLVAQSSDSVLDVQLKMSRDQRWAIPVIEAGRYRGIFTADRLISLYRQISRGGGSWTPPPEWRDAIREAVSSWRRPR